jgi:hypothetical protein
MAQGWAAAYVLKSIGTGLSISIFGCMAFRRTYIASDDLKPFQVARFSYGYFHRGIASQGLNKLGFTSRIRSSDIFECFRVAENFDIYYPVQFPGINSVPSK